MAREFKQFDIISADDVKSIKDHYYDWPQWRILEEGLPDSIFVRVYEKRIDLLRAVIIGPKGTPYHDGLFFFDIQFPSNYPASPPKVHYRSPLLEDYYRSSSSRRRYTLSPSIDSNGHVWLSLLNTWNPSESPILHVLESIQGLVLNGKPYFNSPGFESLFINSTRPCIEKRSLRYNVEVFINSGKTMMSILKKPPKYFEEFVSQHFRDRASTILVAFNAYINGEAEIGDPITTTAATETTSLTSSGFKTEAVFLYPRLVDSFIKNGSPPEIIESLDTSKNVREKTVREHRISQLVFGTLFTLFLFAIIFFKNIAGARVFYTLVGFDFFFLLLLVTSCDMESN
ncbi:hypothetical protein MKX03_024757 [Papaver bracteatum]|nr:hypothetical protein MKX03_024757 [Papaver bracteatum]